MLCVCVCVEGQMVCVVLLGEQGWAGLGVAGAQLKEVCRDDVFLWNQTGSRAGHGCSIAHVWERE